MKVPNFLLKIGAKLKDASPDICVVSGTALMIAGGVWGCVQTAKHINDILDEHNHTLEDIKNTEITDDYTEKDQKADVRTLYLWTIGQVAKTYAGPITMVAIGATVNGIGFGNMKKRYLGAAAAYNTLSAAYDRAMDRVRERWGEEGERWARYGQDVEEIEDKETGEKKKINRGSEDLLHKCGPYYMAVDCGLLYENSLGDSIMLRHELQDYENVLNVQYNAGIPIWYMDVVRYIYGNQYIKKLEDQGIMVDSLRNLGWWIKDPNNKQATDDRRPINLRIDTFFGKKGDDDPYDQDKVWVTIDPNVAGIISLSAGAGRKVSVGGRYIGTV